MKLPTWSKLLICALAFGASSALAADYPTRMVRVVVPSTPGTAPDIITRLVAERLAKRMGQPVVVENKPGGNGIVGMNELLNTKPDGYTLGIFHAAAAVTTPVMYKAATFDVERDTDIVATIAYTPMMLVANTDAPYKTLADVLQAAKAQPDEIVLGNPTRGSVPHLSAEMMGQMAGATFRHISFGGTTQAVQATVGGDTPVYIDGIAPLVPLVQSGRLRALAVTADTELPGLEGIPLAKDTVPDMVVKGWFALLAPKGTPGPVLDRLHADIQQILAEPDFVARLKELGTYPMAESRQQAQTFVQNEKKLWREVITEAGVKAE